MTFSATIGLVFRAYRDEAEGVMAIVETYAQSVLNERSENLRPNIIQRYDFFYADVSIVENAKHYVDECILGVKMLIYSSIDLVFMGFNDTIGSEWNEIKGHA